MPSDDMEEALISWDPWTSLSSISPSPPPELPLEHTEGSLTWISRLVMEVWQQFGNMRICWCRIKTSLARADDPASTLAGTLVTIGEGVPDFEETSLPSSGDLKAL